ncbi:protein RALF-like 34 isoform X2 [Phalaenopsis equestris]|uniref:protein RALF-like 34 isoform X1 n=1 Tax=Phalaenopsis equestris TaxID=78828 RepID=UPI0009E5F470|nr:protein RALF-like 34 isoform X1 [Phalaenopsis equestris]XP_020573645.1 protein RALF-like 34 isoform X2 [Phalaenopsis equestris]
MVRMHSTQQTAKTPRVFLSLLRSIDKQIKHHQAESAYNPPQKYPATATPHVLTWYSSQYSTSSTSSTSSIPTSSSPLTSESMSPTASSLLSSLLLLTSLFYLAGNANAQVSSGSLHLIADAIDWPVAASAFSSSFGSDPDDDLIRDADESGIPRRSLFWHRRNLADYYISYGALSANRVPCPPRSGRSYYTHNCHRARGPVYPYSRGCNSITLCRR